jgi:hypothetical protein
MWSVTWKPSKQRQYRAYFGMDALGAEVFADMKAKLHATVSIWFGDYFWMEGGHVSLIREPAPRALRVAA